MSSVGGGGGAADPLDRDITLNAGVSAAAGDLIGFSAGWVLADADARIPARLMAMEAIAAGGTGEARQSGVFVTSGLTAGTGSYLTTTPGGRGAIPAISTTLTVIQRIGIALSTTLLAFDLSQHGPTILRFQATINPGSIPTGSNANITPTITGLAIGDLVLPAESGGAGNPLLMLTPTHWRVNVADTLELTVANPSAAASDPPAITWNFYVHRY